MKTQGAKVIAIANADDTGIAALASDCVRVETASEYLLPILEVVPLQLFSYFMALEHGVDVDRPRNLSKAVVERRPIGLSGSASVDQRSNHYFGPVAVNRGQLADRSNRHLHCANFVLVSSCTPIRRNILPSPAR